MQAYVKIATFGNSMNNKKLKVGVMLDSMHQPAWVYHCLETISQGDYATIDTLILNATPVAPASSLTDKLLNNLEHLPSAIFEKVLHWIYKKILLNSCSEFDAFQTRKLDSLLGGCHQIPVLPIQTRFIDRFPTASVQAIQDRELDVILRFGFRIIKGDILHAARCGIWSFHHGDNMVNRGGPAGFWEVLESWPVTGSVLQILTDDLDNGKVLYRSWTSTNDMSIVDNNNAHFWKTLAFMPRKLRELHALGCREFLNRVESSPRHPEFYSKPLYKFPGNSDLLKLLLEKTFQKIKGRLSDLFYFGQWAILYSFGDEITGALWRYKRITPPKNRFWADPFPVYRNGKYYIFLEEYLYEENKAHIAVIELDESGQHGPARPVLEKPYHLSYPFIFEYEGSYYMVPETFSHQTIELYRCTSFPDQWEFRMELMSNISAADATLYFYHGKWWLFANMPELDGASTWDELHLFYSDELLSQNWTPHPANPIVSDARNSRPAGAIFEKDGRLYRPAQNCQYRYGYGFNMNEITCLTETEYREHPVARVTPDWAKDIVATHTFNHVNKLSVIDGHVRRRK